MFIAVLIVLLLNIVLYLFVIINYIIDCKNIGKNNLAVSFKDRLLSAFFFITLPCIVGLLWR